MILKTSAGKGNGYLPVHVFTFLVVVGRIATAAFIRATCIQPPQKLTKLLHFFKNTFIRALSARKN